MVGSEQRFALAAASTIFYYYTICYGYQLLSKMRSLAAQLLNNK